MSNSKVVHMPAQVAPPSFSEIGSFIARLRYDIRQALAGIDRATDEARRIRREVLALKESRDAAHAGRIQTLEHEADRLEAHHGTLAEVIRKCGYALMEAAPMIDACTTLAQRCELLNINVADREGITEADGLAALVLDHGIEDSAASRHCWCKDGPLFHAVYRVFADFLATARDGQVGGRCTFSPGGLFFDSLCNPAAARAEMTATFH
ncbi:hypothetical protein [Paraburkholderia elongata]|uniref:Uncharacterized protein n=1 Tax=Paraburkholderia elongata TaxID=2675747 RepID=A0A972SPM8_9BURK|nr:hypothetical protein [Paraburkholderia elongata]NPT61210.1 hypothetical protein [Paraburkholderia elongata]